MFKKIQIVLAIFFLIGSPVLAEKKVDLPKPNGYGKMSIEETILRRRSERNFKANELSMQQISQLLWAAQGVTDNEYGFRAAPSAGALYPLSIYVLKNDGVFQYLPSEHKLLQLFDQDKRPSLVRASLGQGFIKEAPVSILITGNFSITQEKYGPRTFRYVCMEVGHVAENIHLQAVALGLGSVPVGAFWNDVVKSTLELPEEEEPLYIIPIGYIER